MTPGKLSEETIKRLPVPETGNRIIYFAGATIQGAKAPRGFGVRVTAAAPEPSYSTTACAAANTASQSAPGPIGPRSKPFAKLAICASALIGARTPLRTVRPPPHKPLPSVLDDFVARYVRNKEATAERARPIRKRVQTAGETAHRQAGHL